MNKIDARKYGQKQRALISKEDRKQRSYEIEKKVISLIQLNQCIGCYVSINNEVETKGILNACFLHQVKICVPKVVGKTLEFYEIHDWSDLTEGAFHVLEPNTNKKIEIEEIDLMIVPLSAFDSQYHRCGYGKGYYDSILDRCSKKIGIAYLEQEVNEIEVEPFDISLDDVIVG